MIAESKRRCCFIWCSVLLAIFIDQLIKIAVKTSMPLGGGFSVFGDWCQIRFIENNGMAFGMELGSKLFLTGFRIVAVIVLVYILIRLIRNRDYPLGFVFTIAMILAGAVGNIVDCLFYGEIFSSSYGQIAHFVPWGEGYASFMEGRVVDMFYFPLFDYKLPWMEYPRTFFGAVFNFADSCVTCGAIYLLLFQYKYFSKEEK